MGNYLFRFIAASINTATSRDIANDNISDIKILAYIFILSFIVFPSR